MPKKGKKSKKPKQRKRQRSPSSSRNRAHHADKIPRRSCKKVPGKHLKSSTDAADIVGPQSRRPDPQTQAVEIVVHDSGSEDERLSQSSTKAVINFRNFPNNLSTGIELPVQTTTSSSTSTNSCTQHSRCFDHICKVCKVDEIRSACRPCGHFCICKTCYERMSKVPWAVCPICRMRIVEFIRINFWLMDMTNKINRIDRIINEWVD